MAQKPAPMSMQLLQEAFAKDGTVTFIVRIHPGARKTEITETLSDGTMKIDITSAPEDGKANAELLDFLAEAFQVSRKHIAILSGVTARRKLIRITR